MFQPDEAKYMDHYEQALYNHILASVAENSAGQHVPRSAQSRRAQKLRQRRT